MANDYFVIFYNSQGCGGTSSGPYKLTITDLRNGRFKKIKIRLNFVAPYDNPMEIHYRFVKSRTPREIKLIRQRFQERTKLRNLVYEFAAVSEQPIQIACKTPKASQKGDTVQENKKAGTYAGLTSVCRQVRKEYLPIQRREVNLRINLWDLEKFFATFDLLHWATTSQPRGLDISIPFPLYRTSKIDILPLVQLYSLGHLTTTVPVPPTEEDVEVEEIGSPLYKKMDTEQWMIVDRYMRDIQENWDHEPFFTGRVKKIDYFPRISMPPRIVLMTRDPAL
ncbi:hypothetical protein PtrSN002B_006940 [Pyrenophora tritici-repentis]|uniref:Uncharacterized protein n=2 Tax=Pyrenophora tritici-repentis TaxID=45151 RepID=A0A2W1DTU0_9PLEO|nr:uncharacterized protein PTRG_02460 [Pyrenophora tritici-repentis Pt-1C-BFP]KAI0575293.1 hypothetical protein Alg215_08111 [Pyrenophora tritici-repentis]EDU44983.1 predicted protein [Pyrenophora tritici-repentis Pt-1C-BFP]KAI0582976.1 hypothetical protein Alg130_05899 [Pyrenophora tritici-repentis]KAI0609861.1 hypothetical protein TUN205_05886 [Pyrenophora tritici-repentis]KAI0621882.1 hypothetical protein TUN199_06120 [Pyrenophora tritici-repentis]